MIQGHVQRTRLVWQLERLGSTLVLTVCPPRIVVLDSQRMWAYKSIKVLKKQQQLLNWGLEVSQLVHGPVE